MQNQPSEFAQKRTPLVRKFMKLKMYDSQYTPQSSQGTIEVTVVETIHINMLITISLRGTFCIFRSKGQ